ncbi:hypothetical protein [Halodurantibacterium flavum]|uniref:Uncharacterized protein n=1 Tax=Halodurantibacterium flavum TaxID=1382802 RepID=A0ABW4S1W6_9RHOB
MPNATHDRLEQIARGAGWDSYTLLLLIGRWAEATGQARPLLGYLKTLAREEDGAPAED